MEKDERAKQERRKGVAKEGWRERPRTNYRPREREKRVNKMNRFGKQRNGRDGCLVKKKAGERGLGTARDLTFHSVLLLAPRPALQ